MHSARVGNVSEKCVACKSKEKKWYTVIKASNNPNFKADQILLKKHAV